jgi:hypothetical protein
VKQILVPLTRHLTLLFIAPFLVLIASCGCTKNESPILPVNRSPVLDSLVAFPDTIGPSDSTLVICFARDADGDSLVYDWLTDSRLKIQGAFPWNSHLNNQPSPERIFYNADLPNPINDSAWVYCLVRDPYGGGASRHVYITLQSAPSPR